MSARRIALLGARRTGKTTLAHELAEHLRARGLETQFEIIEGDAPSLAAADLRAGDAALLMGLDLPATEGTERSAADTSLRALLQGAGIRYQVVYGSGPQRLQAALLALESAGVLPAGTAPRASGDAGRRWAWVCEKCSDPECEHRLFTQLQDRRG